VLIHHKRPAFAFIFRAFIANKQNTIDAQGSV
jgi:hypothetical protein